MKNKILVLLTIAVVSFTGCSQKMILSGIFWDIDKDGDKKLNLSEYHDTRKDWLEEDAKKRGVSTISLAKKEFEILDTDNDNFLTSEEFFDEETNKKVYKDLEQ
ncbi:MAG TPA: hypothetical protein EYG95_03240 [Campylobacterales bacterium]|nr:hypothetical protein [Campylobacterales bacterium]